MAIVVADRVKVRARTTGTGPFSIESTFPGFQGFEAVGDGNETYYGIYDAAGNWEVGQGTYTESNQTVSRDSIIASSNSGSIVDFPDGGKVLYVTVPSAVLTDIATNVIPVQTGNSGKYLSTDGSNLSWETVEAVGGSNPFDQDLNTTDNVSFNSVNTGLVGAPTDLLLNLETYTTEGAINSWNFNTDGSLTFPGGSTIDTQGPLSQGDFNITIPGDIAGTPQQFRFTDESGTGELVFPDGTYQKTAFVTNGNSILYPGDITQSYQVNTLCTAAADTIVYTATGTDQMSIKLFVMVEGLEDGGSTPETQACDIIAVRGFTNNIVHVTAYGVTYSGAAALATFDGQVNLTSGLIEITCRPASLTNSVTASVHAISMTSTQI